MSRSNNKYIWILGGDLLQLPNLFFPIDVFDIQKNISLLKK
jgi:hypothetical protein